MMSWFSLPRKSPSSRESLGDRRISIVLTTFVLLIAVVGCTAPPVNPRQPASESVVLSATRQLTAGFSNVGDGAFSPDMRWVIFSAAVSEEKFGQVFVAPLRWDGETITGMGRPIRVSPTGSRNAGAVVSPDGRSFIIASTGQQEPGTGESGTFLTPQIPEVTGSTQPTEKPIRLFRADVWEPAVTSARPGSIVDLAKYPIQLGDAVANGLSVSRPVYSPDGQWIAADVGFSSGVPSLDGPTDARLLIARADGKNAIVLPRDPLVNTVSRPRFSPDGQRLLYVKPVWDSPSVNRLNISFDLVVAKLDREKGDITGWANEKVTTIKSGSNGSADWHPSGKHIVYSSVLTGETTARIRIIRTDGTLRTNLTQTGSGDFNPVISADGKYILWTSQRSPDGSSQLFIAKLTLPRGI